MRWLHVIFTHAVFISFCAVALAWQTTILLQHRFEPLLAVLIFLSTFCSYNILRLISIFPFGIANRPIQFFSNQIPVLVALSISGLVMLYIIHLFPDAMIVVITGTLLTILYSFPLWPGKSRKVAARAGFLKTCLLAFTWTYMTISLPLLLSPLDFTYDVWLLFATRFFFMLILCIIFDARDVAVDRLRSFSSLATVVKGNVLHVLVFAVFVLFLLASYLLCKQVSAPQQGIAFIFTGLVTAIVYFCSLKKRGYYFYYFLVDGLMMFSTLSTFLATF